VSKSEKVNNKSKVGQTSAEASAAGVMRGGSHSTAPRSASLYTICFCHDGPNISFEEHQSTLCLQLISAVLIGALPTQPHPCTTLGFHLRCLRLLRGGSWS
jgi:hypothetical protein